MFGVCGVCGLWTIIERSFRFDLLLSLALVYRMDDKSVYCYLLIPGRFTSSLLPHVLDKSALYRRHERRRVARTPRAPAKGGSPLHSCFVTAFTSPCTHPLPQIPSLWYDTIEKGRPLRSLIKLCKPIKIC